MVDKFGISHVCVAPNGVQRRVFAPKGVNALRWLQFDLSFCHTGQLQAQIPQLLPVLKDVGEL